MKIAGWFRRNNTIMAQAKDLRRQLQEAWDNEKVWGDMVSDLREERDGILDQLHRVARERDNERELRLDIEEHYDELLNEERNRRIEAEVALLDYHLDNRAADLVDIYLENEEE